MTGFYHMKYSAIRLLTLESTASKPNPCKVTGPYFPPSEIPNKKFGLTTRLADREDWE